MNENNNRALAVLTPRQVADVQTALNQLERMTQSLVALTPEERITLPKISVDNRVFVTDAVNMMSTPAGASVLPAFLKPADAKTDIEMFEQLDGILARLDTIRAKINDHRILAGSEAYSTALTFKKLAEAAYDAGVPGTQAVVEQLRQRFAGQGGSGSAKSA